MVRHLLLLWASRGRYSTPKPTLAPPMCTYTQNGLNYCRTWSTMSSSCEHLVETVINGTIKTTSNSHHTEWHLSKRSKRWPMYYNLIITCNPFNCGCNEPQITPICLKTEKLICGEKKASDYASRGQQWAPRTFSVPHRSPACLFPLLVDCLKHPGTSAILLPVACFLFSFYAEVTHENKRLVQRYTSGMEEFHGEVCPWKFICRGICQLATKVHKCKP